MKTQDYYIENFVHLKSKNHGTLKVHPKSFYYDKRRLHKLHPSLKGSLNYQRTNNHNKQQNRKKSSKEHYQNKF